MKVTVNYYDFDEDKTVTKTCFQFNNTVDDFSFIPIDNPVTIYKSVVIKDAKVSIFYDDNKVTLRVNGWQYIKGGGYDQTQTTILIKK